MSDRTAPATCQHEYTPAPIDNHRFARVCRCGEIQVCSTEELRYFLNSCKIVRAGYIEEQGKTESKSTAETFQKGIDLKNQQIAWLKSQLQEEV